MTTQTETASEQRDALAARLFQSALAVGEVTAVYLGDRLGYYRALRDGGPATSTDLAARTGTAERYAREWLEQQAVAGVLTVDDAAGAPLARRYALPEGHAEVFLDPDSLVVMTPMVRQFVGAALQLPRLLDAYRTGEGVAWEDYGADMWEGQAEANRPQFLNLLGADWFPKVPDVHARLQASTPARVADIGCGGGWSSIAIAKAYPNARVDGFDPDAAAIASARANAAAAGVADRVSFHAVDAATVPGTGVYDLVTAFETIHDMARPVEVLRTVRRLAGDTGAVIVMDESVGEAFTAPANEVERFFYAASLLVCLPNGLAETPSSATGTVMRPDTLRRYAQEAGFAEVSVLPIEHDFWRFYRLHP